MWSLWDRMLWTKQLWDCTSEATFWLSIPFAIIIICKMLYLRIVEKKIVKFNVQNIKNYIKRTLTEVLRIPIALLEIVSIAIVLDYFRCQILMYVLVKILKFKILIDVIMSKIS